MQKQSLYYDMTFEEFVKILKELEEVQMEILKVSVSRQEKTGCKLADLRFTINVKVF